MTYYKRPAETPLEKVKMPLVLSSFFFIHNFYTPVEDGTYNGITRGGRAAFSSLSGAYLQNYST